MEIILALMETLPLLKLKKSKIVLIDKIQKYNWTKAKNANFLFPTVESSKKNAFPKKVHLS